MKILKIITLVTLATVLSLSSLSAHSLWVNSFESFVHKPGHTTVGLGWGHSIPVDDIPNSPNAKVMVEAFSITDPNGEKTALKTPPSKTAEPEIETKSFDVYSADIGLQKIALKEDSPKGVYKIEAKSKPTFYTRYIDTKDRKRLKLKPKDKIENIKTVLFSVKYEAFAKSYLTLGKWEEQKATNNGLEIIPKTDLSNVKVGDMVEFEVLFFGKPLHMSGNSNEYVTAMSNTFGQGKGFSLFSKIKNGKAQFEVQTAGQWRVSCGHGENVTKDGELKDLYGKVNKVVHMASLTFNVK